MRKKLTRIIEHLDAQFKEREEEIKGLLLGMIAGEHVLLFGPPGTAKSLLVRTIGQVFGGKSFFTYLLTRFSTPEEIFGPLSITALEDDRYERKIDGYLPQADLAFLDEIFKANSSILNSLLMILNEREYRNGVHRITVPLRSLVGASNELPEAKQGLEALYDRFLLRYSMNYLVLQDNFRAVVFKHNPKSESLSEHITPDELLACLEKSDTVTLDLDVESTILIIRKELAANDIFISDRRWKKIVAVLRIAAAAEGKSMVDAAHVLLVKHMLWTHPSQRSTIDQLCLRALVLRSNDLDYLKEDATKLHSLVEQKQDYIFPYPIYCATSDIDLTSWRQLNNWAKIDTIDSITATAGSIKTPMKIPKLFQYLKERQGWDFVLKIADTDRKEYIHSLGRLDIRLDVLKTFEEEESKRILTAIESCIWITETDRQAFKILLEEKKQTFASITDSLVAIRHILYKEHYIDPHETGLLFKSKDPA